MTKRELYARIRDLGGLHNFEIPAAAKELADDIWFEVQEARSAARLGAKGGKSTAKKRTPEERSEAARKAVQARWDRAKRTAQGQRR